MARTWRRGTASASVRGAALGARRSARASARSTRGQARRRRTRARTSCRRDRGRCATNAQQRYAYVERIIRVDVHACLGRLSLLRGDTPPDGKPLNLSTRDSSHGSLRGSATVAALPLPPSQVGTGGPATVSLQGPFGPELPFPAFDLEARTPSASPLGIRV